MRAGRPREPVLVFLLTLVTFGAYWFVGIFTVLGLLEAWPDLGILFLLGGVVVWAVWNVQVQRALNRYWMRRAPEFARS